ncbi:hypothetical protein PAMP_009847 [Pampus punctatissimus]
MLYVHKLNLITQPSHQDGDMNPVRRLHLKYTRSHMRGRVLDSIGACGSPVFRRLGEIFSPLICVQPRRLCCTPRPGRVRPHRSAVWTTGSSPVLVSARGTWRPGPAAGSPLVLTQKTALTAGLPVN